MQHELLPNLAVGVDYIYRKYDRGLATYTLGYQPGAPGYPAVADLHRPADLHRSDHRQHRRVLRREAGRDAAVGVGSITVTNPNYQVYNGVDITVTKRYSDKWQFTGALTIQDNPQYFPGRVRSDFANPTGHGLSATASARSPST